MSQSGELPFAFDDLIFKIDAWQRLWATRRRQQDHPEEPSGQTFDFFIWQRWIMDRNVRSHVERCIAAVPISTDAKIAASASPVFVALAMNDSNSHVLMIAHNFLLWLNIGLRGHVSGIADVNLLRYANVLPLRAKARAGKVSYPLHASGKRDASANSVRSPRAAAVEVYTGIYFGDADDADDDQTFEFSAGKRHDIAARRVDDGLDLDREALQRVRFFVGIVIAVIDSAHTGQRMPEHPFGDVLGNTRFRH